MPLKGPIDITTECMETADPVSGPGDSAVCTTIGATFAKSCKEAA